MMEASTAASSLPPETLRAAGPVDVRQKSRPEAAAAVCCEVKDDAASIRASRRANASSPASNVSRVSVSRAKSNTQISFC